MVKPEYNVIAWTGFAPSEETAKQFAAFNALDEGYLPGQLQFVDAKRIG